MESDEDLAHSRGDRVLGSPVVEEEEVNKESWSLPLFFLSERNMSSSESRRGTAGVEEAAEDPADTTFSAWERSLRISHKALVLTKESAALCSMPRLACKGESESLSTHLALVANERSEPNLSPSWMVFWLLVKLLSLCCCWLVCSVEERESSSDWEQGASLAAVSDDGDALVFSGTDTAGPRLSRLNGNDILESTDRMLHLENSPL